MAKRRRRRRVLASSPRRRRRRSNQSNPRRYRARARHYAPRRRARRNPSLRQFASGGMLESVGGVAAGFFGARIIPASVAALAAYNVGFTGYALNIGAGLAVSWAVSRFWSRRAGNMAMVGTGLAVLSRILTEQFGVAGSVKAMSGDVDFDLSGVGYYAGDAFPFQQGAGGPYGLFPGYPSLANPPFPAVSGGAVRAGASAAAMLPMGPAAAAPAIVPAGQSWRGAGRWGAPS